MNLQQANFTDMSPEQLKQLQGALTPKMNKYIPIKPTPKQAAALLMPVKEMLYGGAAGGGKSVYLLAAALQYVDEPNYAAVLFRKTFADLMLPGALIPMSKEWLAGHMDAGRVRWYDKDKKYEFRETGSTLSFGYLETKDDHLRYQGAEYQFIGMDEITHIAPEHSRYMFSRLRRKSKSSIPLRFRAACNPGGVYGDYYYDRYFVERFDETGKQTRYFLQAGIKDNPHVDAVSYREMLAELDPITRAQLEDGNWEIRPQGDLFDKGWLIGIESADIPAATRWVRFWDLASIDPKYRKAGRKRDPDWSVGFKLGFHQGCYYIGDIIKLQKAPGEMEEIILRTAQNDGHSCAIRMEEEGGASGKANTERFARKILVGYDFAGVKPVVSKIERARPVSAACQVGSVFISKRCRHLTDFYAQIDAFPNGTNDDMVDAFSGAFSYFRPDAGRVAPPTIDSRKNAKRKLGPSHLFDMTPIPGSYWRQSMSG